MLTIPQQIGIIAFFAIAVMVVGKLMKKDDKEFDKLYTKVLTSEEYKVKGRFEE